MGSRLREGLGAKSLIDFDFILVGQGLAGTTLAWCLRWRGARVLVIDRGEAVTSSRVAAGLITPITGQRLTKTWRWDELWPAAGDFYRRVESETGRTYFHPRRSVRLFASQRDRDVFAKRLVEPEFQPLVKQPQPLVNATWFAGELGGFEMPDAGQLDVARFLAESRASFAQTGGYRSAEVDPNRDIEFDGDRVKLPRLDVQARCLIFCQGFAAARNPWFERVPFDATKGEILTIRVPGLAERRVIHRGLWLASAITSSDDADPDSCAAGLSVQQAAIYRVGSTYDWNQLDCEPTASGRDAICARLKQFLRLPFEVIEHQAAVRPIIVGRHPVLGLHPENARIGFFNGLASKGSLQAPFLASQFAAFLSGECDLDREVDLLHRVDWQIGRTAIQTANASSSAVSSEPSPQDENNVPVGWPSKAVETARTALEGHPTMGTSVAARCPGPRRSTAAEKCEPDKPRLIEFAHQLVREVVRPGEVVIDATAGNGHDSLFLARLVGPQGTVFAFDVQPQAIEQTQRRLNEAGCANVALLQYDHARLQAAVRERCQDEIAVVMFNLGYLPGSDKTVTTRMESTLAAIDGAIELLRPGGMLTVIAYPGHPGGAEEAAAVEERLGPLPDDRFEVRKTESNSSTHAAPILFSIIRRSTDG